MRVFHKKILLPLILFSAFFVFHTTTVDASICPRAACSNNCDLTGSECAPDGSGNPRACTVDQQGWWCIQKVDCDPSYPAGVKQEAYQCLNGQWIKNPQPETPNSDCAGFCAGPSPTPYPPGAQACKDRPFQVVFKSSRKLRPGETVKCEIHQTNRLCEPCTGLSKDDQCEFGATFDTCATATTDCLCKFGGFSYTCKLNGVVIPGGTGSLPPSVVNNAQSATINFDPQGGSSLECKIGNSCTNCNGNNDQCYPDCGGGTCGGGVCTSCPANPSVCNVGQSCSGKCNGGKNDVCYPGCNGGICNTNGTCDTCSEAGVVPVVPTLVQQKTVITIAPTFMPLGNAAAAPSKTQRWICLETQPCSDPFSECSGQGDPKHRVALSTGKTALAVANRATYVFECLIGANGLECTSGKANVDNYALQTDMVTKLSGLYGYNRVGFFKSDGVTPETNPFSAGSSGAIPKHEWESTTSTSVGHVFFAMNEVNPDEYAGTSASTKQSTFIMDAVPYSGCLMITSDPYGRVFDSQTLEPIKGAKITLLKKTNDGKFISVKNTDVIGGINNPQTTNADGSFAFRVPDGTYKISIEAKGYKFPVEKNSLNEKYKNVYSNLYTGEEIVQKGKIIHHDIPLGPIDIKKSQLQSTGIKPQMLSLNQSLDKKENIFTLQGVVSHPLSQIAVYGKKPSQNKFVRTRLIMRGQADKQGKFIIKIKQGALGHDEIIGDMEIKKDEQIYSFETETKKSFFGSLSVIMSTFIQKVMGSEKALNTTITLSPIPTKLSGYAYNEAHIAIPNTKVSIQLPFSSQPVSSISTDETGHFTLESQYLPSIPFMIQYKTTTGKTVSKTTTQFILDNSR